MRTLQQLWKRPGRVLWFLCLLLSLPICFGLLAQLQPVRSNQVDPNNRVSEQILVDQFGWRSQSTKVALFANPRQGQNAFRRYNPGPIFEVHQADSDKTVYQGQLIPWQNNAIDPSSGDQVWSGDFSAVETPGNYYIYDPKNRQRSHSFEIQTNPYGPVLTTAVKAFYYQRCGTAIPSEFGGNWSHPPCHIGRHQDRLAARYSNGKEARDVHGGWHDAGDYNKYLPFTAKTLWNLMDAYEANPTAFGDNSNIPESGNGVPDLLDEIKWELDWMLRMQLDNGAVANRVANQVLEDHYPQDDHERRYYTEPTTWGTAAFVVGTANGSRIFEPFEAAYPGYSDRLLAAAEQAWQFLEQHPERFPADGKDHGRKETLSPASQANEEGKEPSLRQWAAAELYRATQATPYQTYFETQGRQEALLEENWFDPYKNLAYITYARTPGANPDTLTTLKASLEETLRPINNLDDQGQDPYRAYIEHYHWGSNQSKANWGLMFLLGQELGFTNLSPADYQSNAEEYLHYFHGRNPLGWVYLSNMGKKGGNAGAEKSVMHLYHGWFPPKSPYDGEKSRYGPAPGFVTGGPNQYYSAKHVSPPYGEPVQKAFKDWNIVTKGLGSKSQAPWEITEPAIYYQAAYVNLLSYFAKAQ